MFDYRQYERGYFMPPVKCNDWVNKEYVDKAPIWCSVDLRDGNQALVEPMSLDEKLEFFQMLVEVGFKEIEIGFPAASETEYELCRETNLNFLKSTLISLLKNSSFSSRLIGSTKA